MHPDVFDRRMRVFETASDLAALPGLYLIARLDGRGFTRLTKEVLPLDKPFDERFRDWMLATTRHLVSDAGFRVVFAYVQSDEISLLLHPNATEFGRKLRKLNSVLAGEASAVFSLAAGHRGAFDCRIAQLPRANDVVDYFRWRQADATRNALTGHCYWLLRRNGASGQEATARLSGLSVADKNELLFAAGLNFNDLPTWQKRGIGVYTEVYEKEALNPHTGEAVTAQRRRLRDDFDLPDGAAFGTFVSALLAGATT
ncbi:MAG: tRNA(His) guanylyltransferase Thg1 family protein [Bacteroidota bacterium]